jgi:hypothetical protein
MKRGLVAAAIAGGFAAAPASAQDPAAPAAAPACETRRTEDRIAAVTERGEIRLSSGQTVKLSGLRLPDDEAQAKAAHALLASFGDAPLAVGATASAPDRWGRLPPSSPQPRRQGPSTSTGRSSRPASPSSTPARPTGCARAGFSPSRVGRGTGALVSGASSAISRWLRTISNG